MLKQKTVSTELGQITVSSLTLGEIRQLDSLFRDGPAPGDGKLDPLLKYLPLVFASVRKVHQDMSLEQLESGLTFDDFLALFSAVLEVSGLKRKPLGEATPVPV